MSLKIKETLSKIYAGAICVAIFVIMCPLDGVGQMQSRIGSKPIEATKWVDGSFAKGKIPPFSFVYNGVASKNFIKKWAYTAKQVNSDDANVDKYSFSYKDPASGLVVVCDVKAFKDFNAVEWVLRFTNTASQNSPTIENVKVVDLDLQYENKGEFKLHYSYGSHVSKSDFHARMRVLNNGDRHLMSPEGGRSSQVEFPFFNIESASNAGVVVSIGWTGTWFADIARTTEQGVCLSTGMKSLSTFLLPQEQIRTPSTAMLFWNGEDRIVGHNLFRRFILAHHTNKINGEPTKYPISSSFNYGDPSPCNEYTCLTSDYAVALVKRYKQFNLIPEVFWLDAGWYSQAADYKNNKNWANTVGNWTVDSVRFPQGLKPIADEVHKVGAKFMVWFEPERVIKGSQWAVEHPEWMLDAGGDAYLFDLGNREACAWMSKYIGDMLEENGIDYYRQDFNMEPDVFWRANDKPGRTGICEIRHIEGLYAFWDYLLDRFPALLIDNCASGGRRIDLETTSRSAPLWRTDYNYGEHVGYQCHTYGLSMYLPMHATGAYITDRFAFRSSLGSAVIYNWKVTNANMSFTEMQECMKEFNDVRPYFSQDYYPLTGFGDMTSDSIWLAYQLNRPSDNTGYVVAFRRAECPDRSITVKFKGLDKTKTYIIENYSSPDKIVVSGRQLSEQGFEMSLGEPRSSLLLKYRVQ